MAERAKKTRAKKPAKPKRDIVAEWTEGYRYFIEGCRAHFSFLCDEHGFEEPDASVMPPECVVIWKSGESFVRVHTEYGTAPWVVVKVDGHEHFGLHTIIDELEPAYAEEVPTRKGSSLKPEEMDAYLAYESAFLKRRMSELFAAGPDLFERLKARERTAAAERD